MSKLTSAWHPFSSHYLPEHFYWTVSELPETAPFQEGEPSYMHINYDNNSSPFWYWAETDITVDGIRSYCETPDGRDTVTTNWLCELKQDYHGCDTETPGWCSCYGGNEPAYIPCDYCWMSFGRTVSPGYCGHDGTKMWEPRGGSDD